MRDLFSRLSHRFSQYFYFYFFCQWAKYFLFECFCLYLKCATVYSALIFCVWGKFFLFFSPMCYRFRCCWLSLCPWKTCENIYFRLSSSFQFWHKQHIFCYCCYCCNLSSRFFTLRIFPFFPVCIKKSSSKIFQIIYNSFVKMVGKGVIIFSAPWSIVIFFVWAKIKTATWKSHDTHFPFVNVKKNSPYYRCIFHVLACSFWRLLLWKAFIFLESERIETNWTHCFHKALFLQSCFVFKWYHRDRELVQKKHTLHVFALLNTYGIFAFLCCLWVKWNTWQEKRDILKTHSLWVR